MTDNRISIYSVSLTVRKRYHMTWDAILLSPFNTGVPPSSPPCDAIEPHSFWSFKINPVDNSQVYVRFQTNTSNFDVWNTIRQIRWADGQLGNTLYATGNMNTKLSSFFAKVWDGKKE